MKKLSKPSTGKETSFGNSGGTGRKGQGRSSEQGFSNTITLVWLASWLEMQVHGPAAPPPSEIPGMVPAACRKKLSRWFPCLLKSEPQRWKNFLNRPYLYSDKTLGRTGFLSGGWEGGREGNAITREIWLKAAVSSGAAESRASSLLPQGSQPGHKGWKKWVGRDSRISGSCALRKCTHTHTPRCALSAPEIPLDGMTVAYSFCSSFHSERLSSRRCWGTEDPRLKEKKEASENREDLPLSTPLRLHPDLLPLSPEAGWRGVPERAREGADTGPHAGKQHA